MALKARYTEYYVTGHVTVCRIHVKERRETLAERLERLRAKLREKDTAGFEWEA